MKKRNLKILGFGLIAIIYIAFAQIFGNKRDKRNFDKFYSSEIRGSLKEVEIKYHGVGFRVHNDSTEYVFYPYTSIINQKKIFDHFATKGDSVIKKRHQDTLILLKEDRRYLYTFQKFK
jgi:predicted membrane protein